MATQQTADIGVGAATRPETNTTAPRQMTAGAPAKDGKAPRVVAAFGSGGGAAIVFSDLASI